MYWTYIHTKIGPKLCDVYYHQSWELVAILVAFLRSTSPVCSPFLPLASFSPSLCPSHAVLNNYCGNAYTTTHPATTSWGHFVGSLAIYTCIHECRQFKDASQYDV